MVVLHSDTRRNWQLSASACRLFLRIAGLHVETDFDPRTIGPERVIMAANHASYLDGLLLLSALPQPVNLVAKRES
jgi:1-acyl-sn-glycerol-3-phosphate acyltransferase